MTATILSDIEGIEQTKRIIKNDSNTQPNTSYGKRPSYSQNT